MEMSYSLIAELERRPSGFERPANATAASRPDPLSESSRQDDSEQISLSMTSLLR